MSGFLSNIMDILKIFRMQEPVSKQLLTKSSELGQYKEVVQEKDVLIRNNTAKLKELENELSELKTKNEALEARLKASSLDENGFQEVMMGYDELFKKVWVERQGFLDKNAVLLSHIENLETSHADLVDKLGKAKEVIDGYKENQEILKTELKEYRQIVDIMEKRYETLKQHSESRISEANIQIDNKEKDNIQEVAKLKAKILQSQAKIIQLGKHVKLDTVPSKKSMFAPLRNNISKT
ncbi:unnamed protein product [Phaedon cochleariae]|uniref:Transforming acidic coiled-coil-containing protein C-terminal domain-containing protein n=1 Tax=Phaedon cochleariae TaxID=80249 RepID=A0A9P0DSK0_PHACE|nr:unnamed protein product [Phaedon cochleariae]